MNSRKRLELIDGVENEKECIVFICTHIAALVLLLVECKRLDINHFLNRILRFYVKKARKSLKLEEVFKSVKFTEIISHFYLVVQTRCGHMHK